MKKQVYVHPCTYFLNEMPYSEVCMHMGIAGREMVCVISSNGRSLQLYTPDATVSGPGQLIPFSAPILVGEAGIFEDSHGFYIYR